MRGTRMSLVFLDSRKWRFTGQLVFRVLKNRPSSHRYINVLRILKNRLHIFRNLQTVSEYFEAEKERSAGYRKKPRGTMLLNAL